MTNLIIKWYRSNKRDLPWRKTKNPYCIWVSEIILQQTQIKTGIKYYKKFLKKFPNISSLANSKEEDVLKIWQGLGYYNRAINMLYTAKTIAQNYNNNFPLCYDELIKLKGIGEYTAAAISSICYDEKKAVVDGNVYRFLSRYYNIDTPINTSLGKRQFQNIADKLIPKTGCGEYNQAIMDFGSLNCKKNNPTCITCPIKRTCKAFKLGNVQQLPVKKPKKNIKTRYLNYLFINQKKQCIIQQRNSKDIWNKLYELPLIETDCKITFNQLKSHIITKQFKILNINFQCQFNHILSHQRLIISFWDIKINNINAKKNSKKILIKDINKYPLPKPIEKYFHKEHLII
ncbi:MAG: A/G-specific adenine glycosylase [Flavobacteriales bacterium]|nr:A/G-specific adenine glycosylase [Flavobacteriales bacterium]